MGRLDAAWEGRTFELNKLLQGTDLAVSTALGLAMVEMPKAIEYSKDKYATSVISLGGAGRATSIISLGGATTLLP